MSIEDLTKCTGFEWDAGNDTKNWEKHSVSSAECEQVFFNSALLLATDDKHSQLEPRYAVLGKTDNGRLLFLAVTVRGELIRVVSARDMSRAERAVYAKEEASQVQD